MVMFNAVVLSPNMYIINIVGLWVHGAYGAIESVRFWSVGDILRIVVARWRRFELQPNIRCEHETSVLLLVFLGSGNAMRLCVQTLIRCADVLVQQRWWIPCFLSLHFV